jgi:histidinol dehydrogenase
VLAASLAETTAVVAPGEAAAATVVDRLAPEHVQVVTAEPDAFLEMVSAFGAAFLGPLSPVPFGDYGVGSNHVLPTMGTARFASGLRASDFVRVSSYIRVDSEGLTRFGSEVEAVARAEGLDGHARAVEVRRST